jgi:hypothetical protein
MPQDELARLEAALAAAAKIVPDDNGDIEDARCPNCKGSDFAKVSDLYSEAVRRVGEDPEAADVPRAIGMTYRQILERFRPPQRTSVLGVVGVTTVILGAIAYIVMRRFGDTAGQLAAAGGVVILAGVTLTSLRRFSDQYYHRRRAYNRLYKCRRCGQLISA